MQALKFDAVINEAHTLTLVLPDHIRPGKAEVVVMVDADDPSAASAPMTDEEFEALMRFGDGRRLDGLSIKDLIAEGRR
jgi:hypothetical protein